MIVYNMGHCKAAQDESHYIAAQTIYYNQYPFITPITMVYHLELHVAITFYRSFFLTQIELIDSMHIKEYNTKYLAKNDTRSKKS